MAEINRARVCAVGSEQDMKRLLTQLLDNCAYLDPDTELRPDWSVAELLQQIRKRCAEDGGEGDTFLYEMVSDSAFGDALPCSLRLDVAPAQAGLWTALFTYDSEHRFQAHEWLDLHRRCGRILMVAQRASQDFTLDKGEVIFSAGRVLENWDAMCECWLWLMMQYGAGVPPTDAVRHLHGLARVLEEEEYDMTVRDLLTSCESNLIRTAEAAADGASLEAAMRNAREAGRFDLLTDCQYTVAEAVLWETVHNAKWLACLNAVIEAWDGN